MKKRNWRLMLRRVLNLVFSRIVVTGVLLLLQAFWLFALFYWLADYAKWFGGVGVAMSIIMCLALIRQDSTVPEFKISWMILFAVMPVQGGILYLLWGNKRPALGLRHRLERAEDAMAPARKDDPDAAAALQRQDPRAALTADEIAKEADFFSFGTNDLTQMTFGFSRDDAGKFLAAYYDAKIFENDPFAKLDQTGVGALMQMAVEKGKKVRPELHCGICGEHGGDPMSVEFCHRIGLDYVSCSPFRVPIARLAAAQAAIKEM